MIKSILLTAIRNLFRNGAFSAINLIGLSISMSLGLLIIVIAKEQYSFDNFHKEGDRIYRVNTRAIRVEGGSEPYASAPVPLGRALRDQYSFADEVVVFTRQLNGDAEFGNTVVPIRGYIADPAFLKIFNFPLEKGNPATALDAPNSLVLTQEGATKIFGLADPLGETLTLKGYGEFIVTGLLKDFPGKTHFEFEALISTASIPAFEKDRIVSQTTDNWNNYYSGHIYLKLAEGRSPEEVQSALNEISKTQYANLMLETRDKGYEFYLQPLDEITPGPQLSNNVGHTLPDLLLYFMGALATIVMVMACFNYTNLMIAKSLSRAREIGIRKVVGGHRWQVFLQFIGESVVFSMVALAISYLLYQLIKPGFAQLHIMQEFTSMTFVEDAGVLVLFVLFAMLVGVLAGALPAGYLSSFKPVRVLKEVSNLKIYSRLTFRKILMVMQFTFSLVFILFVIVVYRQVQFMVNADYGFNEKNIVNVELRGVDYNTLVTEVSSLSEVQSIGGVSHRLGTWEDRANDYKLNRDDKPFVMRDFVVNATYVDNLGLEFVAGRNFSRGNAVNESEVILNESALKSFGFSDAAAAIGQGIYEGDSTQLQVVGVVRDFHYRPMSYQIGPIALRNSESQFGLLSVKLTNSDVQRFVTHLEPIWKKHDPVHPLVWNTMTAELDNAYKDAGFTDIYTIVGYIAFVAISLACLGMLGMAMYAAKTRTKEIGVRKVMGATVADVVMLLSKSFMILIAIAVVIGVPVGFMLSDLFLSNYAYKIEITPWLILSGITFLGVLALVTISSQTLRAATTNPVDSLRYE
ncbi:MAG: ABC transporter permease [Cyclobacteriaceae bacterium]